MSLDVGQVRTGITDLLRERSERLSHDVGKDEDVRSDAHHDGLSIEDCGCEASRGVSLRLVVLHDLVQLVEHLLSVHELTLASER